MTITKEKKAAPKGLKLPSKTFINLAQKESKKRDVLASILGLVLILIMAGCIAKFGVIDQFARQNRAESEYNTTHEQYLAVQKALEDYPQVEERYRTYSRSWLDDSADDGLVTVDRTKILDLLEQYLRSRGTVNAVTVKGTVMIVNMSGMNLQQISDMLAQVEQQPIVASAALNIASTEDQSADSQVEFTLTIAVQPVEEVEE